MNLYHSETYRNDLSQTIEANDWIGEFAGTSVMITGAAGLICSAVADLLLYYSEEHDGCIQVYAAGRNEEKMLTRFSRYADRPYFHYVKYDASKPNTLEFHADYVIHGASNAYPAAFQSQPVETMKDNFSGMLELLDFAERECAKNTVLISSSEVYGRKASMEPFTEDEYGFIDILNPRSAYSEGKRAAETLCASYAFEKQVPVSIIRPGHIYGPTAGRSDNRVSSAFAYDVVDGKDIVLKSDGSQIRSYCYMLDCATAILLVSLKGAVSTAYNISNPDSVMSIRDIASLFAEHAGTELRFELPSEKEKAAFNPMQNSSLNSERLQALGWKGIFDSRTGTEHTIRVIREAME